MAAEPDGSGSADQPPSQSPLVDGPPLESQPAARAPLQPPPGRPAHGRALPRIVALGRRIGRQPTAVAALFAVLAAAVRSFRLQQSFDIFIDEITYLRVSQSMAALQGVSLYGRPFYLHPPGFFVLEGIYLRLLRPTGDVVQIVQQVRYFNVALAAVTAALLYSIGRRLGGELAGLVAAAIFAFDPFVIRFSSRNLLEAATMMWVLAGLAVLVPAIRGDRRLSTRRAVVAGLCFGAAVLSKDVAVFLTIVPLGVCFVCGWALARRSIVVIVATTTACYAAFVGIVVATGSGGTFSVQKGQGVLRMLGVVQETGFNRPGSPSLLTAVFGNLDQLAGTYLVMGLGALAVAIMLFHRPRGRTVGDPERRANLFIAALALSSFGLLAYSMAIGTLEEQMFYFLVVPSTLAISIALPQVLPDVGVSPQKARRAQRVMVIAAVCLLAASCLAWGRVRTTPDDGYERLVRYAQARLPRGAKVSATTQTSEFVLSGYDVGRWVSEEAVVANHVQYVVVSTKQVNDGYAFGDAAFFEWVRANGEEVFSFTGPSNGRLSLFRLDRA